MLLSDADIRKELKRGNIIIEPFKEENLQPNGYDIRVGPVYYALDPNLDAFFPFAEEHASKAYVRHEAKPETIHINGKAIKGRFIRLPPHGFVLASTIERIGTKHNLVGLIRCRSSLARTGIDIVRGAGLGDVGFDGNWTIEITNHLPVSYYLPVGLRVGQMIFLRTETPSERPYSGKYAGFTEPVLPKLYRDHDLAALLEVSEE